MPWFAEFKRRLGPAKGKKMAITEAGKADAEEDADVDGEEEAVDVEAEEPQASPFKSRATTKDPKTAAAKAAALERRRTWLQKNLPRR